MTEESTPRLRHLVVMGVSGTGKTSVGLALADQLGLVFIEGDDLHPQSNIDKMAAGTPLTDDDRRPWLATIAKTVAEHDRRGEATVVTCSALRRRYRDLLRGDDDGPPMFFVHLHGSFNLLAERMRTRTKHFMPPSLLQSQFETLEPLDSDEAGAMVDVSPPLEEVVTASIDVVRGWSQA